MASKTIDVVVKAIGGGAMGAAAAAGKIPGSVASAGAALLGGAQGLAASSAIQMAAKADPASFELLMNVIDDLGAVVGQVFTPALKIVTPIVRALSDILDGILTPAMEALEPVINIVIDAINLFIDSLFDLINSIIEMIREVTLGAVDIGKIQRGRSEGKAAGQANFVGVSDMAKESQLAAFGAGRNPAQRTAEATEAIARNTGSLDRKTTDDSNKRVIEGAS